MKRFLSAAVAVGALVAATQANAEDFTPFDNTAAFGDVTFIVSGDPVNGPVSAAYGRTNLPVQNAVTDRFLFTIGADGVGNGTIVTNFNILTGVPNGSNPGNVDLLSVIFNNGVQDFLIPITQIGTLEAGGGSGIPIFAGNLNILSVTYTSRGNGEFGGTLHFEPLAAIPEPTTWAMMLVGFGAVGFAMRRRKAQPKVRFAF